MKSILSKFLIAAFLVGAISQSANAQPIIISSPVLPIPPIVPGFGYRTAADVHAQAAALGLRLENVIHIPTALVSQTVIGSPGVLGFTMTHTFKSLLIADVFFRGGFLGRFRLNPPVKTTAELIEIQLDGTEVYEVTMDEMEFGFPGGLPLGVDDDGDGREDKLLAIKENPDEETKGTTTVKNIGPNLWAITSFFDVFSGIELDQGDGPTFISFDAPVRVDFMRIPEPATLALFGVGLGILGWRRRRA